MTGGHFSYMLDAAASLIDQLTTQEALVSLMTSILMAFFNEGNRKCFLFQKNSMFIGQISIYIFLFFPFLRPYTDHKK